MNSTNACSKFPHPDDCENNIVSRIQRKVATIKSRYPEMIDTAKSRTLDAAPDLDAIEDALDNLLAAMDDVDRLADDDNRPAVAAAMSIERVAYAQYYATVED
jgi:hypothetical protein